MVAVFFAGCDFGIVTADRRGLLPLPPSRGRELPAGNVQVGERQQREHLRTVLGYAAMADLAIAELALYHAEHVLDLGADLAQPAIASAL